MDCSLVSYFSSGRSHICKLEGKERKKSFSLISDHPSTLLPLSTASDPTLLHPPPSTTKERVVSTSNQYRTFTRRRGTAFVLMKSWISHLRLFIGFRLTSHLKFYSIHLVLVFALHYRLIHYLANVNVTK